MITQVSAFNTGSVIKDPRRKAQSTQFKNHSTIAYKGDYNSQYEKQKNNALLTSVSIVAGSILLVLLYSLLSAMDLKKGKI